MRAFTKHNRTMNIVIIGKGNVATNLDYAFRKKGIVCEMASSREGLDELPLANVYIYAVKDEALAEVVAQVKGKERAMHLHTSGSMPISVFGDDKPHAGIFYPFQTFTAGRRVDFRKLYIFIEADDEATFEVLSALAHRLTDHVEQADSARRAVVHLSGVFVNNFTNCLYADAAEIVARVGLPFDVLAPIAEETASKAAASGNPAAVQTGPARRGDEPTLERHRALLADEPQLQDLYNKISENICRNVKTLKNC